MPSFWFFWTADRIEHLEEHGVRCEEFEEFVRDPQYTDRGRSTGELTAEGETSSGRYLFCVYRMIDDLMVEPITAYEH